MIVIRGLQTTVYMGQKDQHIFTISLSELTLCKKEMIYMNFFSHIKNL